jgi:hypothetical protein
VSRFRLYRMLPESRAAASVPVFAAEFFVPQFFVALHRIELARLVDRITPGGVDSADGWRKIQEESRQDDIDLGIGPLLAAAFLLVSTRDLLCHHRAQREGDDCAAASRDLNSGNRGGRVCRGCSRLAAGCMAWMATLEGRLSTAG